MFFKETPAQCLPMRRTEVMIVRTESHLIQSNCKNLKLSGLTINPHHRNTLSMSRASAALLRAA